MKFNTSIWIKTNLSTLSIFSVFNIIVFSDDTILFGTNADISYSIFKLLINLTLSIILLINIKINSLKSTGVIAIVAITCMIGLTSLINLDFSAGQFYQFFVIALSFLIAQNIRFCDFVEVYKKIIYFLCFISICIFFIAINNISILTVFPIKTNTAGVDFINLFVGSVYLNVSEIRNASIFREPGVFMVYILIALIFELFLSTKLNLKLIICAFIALVTTFSTGGLILVLVTIAYLIKKNEFNFNWKLNLALLFFVTTIIGIAIGTDLQSDVFSKLNSDSESYGSTIARIASVVVNFDIFTSNPIFGSGLANYGSLFEKYSYAYFGFTLDASSQSTNTIMAVLAAYGFTFGFIILFGLMRLAGKLANKFVIQCILFLSIGLLFSSQDMRYSLLFFTLVFYGLKSSPNIFSRTETINTRIFIG